MSGGHDFHLPKRTLEQHGVWLPYSEKISLKLKVSFIVLTLILGAICFALMKNHSGHGDGGHHWFSYKIANLNKEKINNRNFFSSEIKKCVWYFMMSLFLCK